MRNWQAVDFGHRALPYCAAACVVVGAACSSDTTSPGTSNTPVTFVHAASAVGALDVYDSTSGSSRKLVASALAFGATDSIVVRAGTHWYDVTLTGQAATVAVPPPPGSSFLLPQTAYDVVALDSGATPAVFGQLLPNILPDTISTNTKVRVVHGDEPLGAVDIYANPSGTAFAGSSPVFSGLHFPQNTSANGNPTYLHVAPGLTEILVLPAGDTNQGDAAVDTTVTLVAGQAVTGVVVANPSVVGKKVLLLVRDR